jgi:cytochrome c
LKLLLTHGADPNGEFKTETALHLAAQRGYLDSVRLLIEAGADVNALTKFREPPIHFARKGGYEDIARYLIASGYVTPQPPHISAKLAAADNVRGEKLFVEECSRCHDAGPERRQFRGPPLWNIVGRRAASIAGFKYSPVMKARGGNWTYEDLNVFLSDPARVLPGTDMGSNGLQQEADRIDLISYLGTRSDNPLPPSSP